MRSSTRSQITVFILLGILLLLGTGIYFYFVSYTENKNIIDEPVVDDVPEHFKKIQLYVLECVERVSVEAVVKIGENGGYIDLDDASYTKRTFQKGIYPTESDVVYLGQSHPVPYWWYLESNNQCFECEMSTENIPSYDDIIDQLSGYIDNNLEQCFAGFESFSDEGFQVTVLQKPETTTTVLTDKVLVQTIVPIDVKKGDSSTHLENFGVELDVSLGKIIGLALYITSYESENQFLESLVMNLITHYSGLDSGKLPPIAAFETGSDKVTWSKSAVKNMINDLLSSYVGLIQVEGTKGAEKIRSDNLYEQSFYDNLFIENNVTMDNILASFVFLDWLIFFDITPSRGEVLEPSSYRREFPLNLVSPVFTNHYEFFYDVAYPVVVELRDESAFNGQGYNFLFALEGNIRDNRNPLEWHMGHGTMGVWDYDRMTYGLRDGVRGTYTVGFDPATNLTINKTFSVPPKSLLCDHNQRVGSIIEVEVINSIWETPVSGASVTFGCGNYKTCTIGNTDSSGYYSSQLPVCAGGYLKVDKEGYLSKVIANISSVAEAEAQYFDMMLDPVRILQAGARIIPISMVNNTNNVTREYADVVHGVAIPLKEEENIILTLSRDKTYPYDQDFFQTFILDNSGTKTLKLVPGNYSIQATLVDNKGILISARDELVGDHLVRYPPINMTPAMLGSIVVDEGSGGFWEVTKDDLEKGDLMFYIIRLERPEKVEDLEQFSRVDEYSYKYRELLIPEFR
ncbi:hypothetical protein JXB31_00565 [Candidatus Woesearchaeota archaeon]|nr:hypothetical protein [Candidatus Woesearchaeota archaeon]